MNILIGCEESGAVRDEFTKRGHYAMSCDLLPSRTAGPHYQGDIRDVLYLGWDAAIFFPTCTYLTVSGLHWNKRRPERAQQTAEGLAFVELLWRAPIARKALENPIGCINSFLSFMPRPQIIQPYEFGDDASKKTCLWLEGFKPLQIDPAVRRAGRVVTWNGKSVERWGNQTDSGQNKLAPSPTRARDRSATYPGIARAMAEQWG